MNIAEYLYFLLPSALKRTVKKLNPFWSLFKVLGRHVDEVQSTILNIREYSMILACPPELLPVFGGERDMPRLDGESINAYRNRLTMKVDIAKMAGTKQGILLVLAALGYENAEIEPCVITDPLRWAEFIVKLGTGNGQAVRDLEIIYQGVLQVKQASSKPAYLLFTDNMPMTDNLMMGTDIASYSELILNDADSIILARDREFNSPLRFSIAATSYKEEFIQ